MATVEIENQGATGGPVIACKYDHAPILMILMCDFVKRERERETGAYVQQMHKHTRKGEKNELPLSVELTIIEMISESQHQYTLYTQ